MSYYSEVLVTFKQEDWKEIYPKLKALDGQETDTVLGRARKIEDEETITFHWDGYNHWGSADAISEAIDQAADRYEPDFARIGESYDDMVIHEDLSAGHLNVQNAVLRGKNEPYIDQADRIITRIMQTCMEKGMTTGKIAKALEGVAGKDVVMHYCDKAKEQSRADSRGGGR